jgi:catechol 2,3-dioxygenase-like lactoylglutathione lyase family enzyme
MITALDHLVLTVRDLPATLRFYVEGLGYGSRPSARAQGAAFRQPEDQPAGRGPRVRAQGGSSDLGLCRSLLPDRAAACGDRHAPGIARLSDHLGSRTAHRRDPPTYSPSTPATPTAISSRPRALRSRHEPSRLAAYFLTWCRSVAITGASGTRHRGAGRAPDCDWGARPYPVRVPDGFAYRS